MNVRVLNFCITAIRVCAKSLQLCMTLRTCENSIHKFLYPWDSQSKILGGLYTFHSSGLFQDEIESVSPETPSLQADSLPLNTGKPLL